MKRNYMLLVFAGLFFALAGSLVISSCTKEGPPGPAGLDGEDAVETCMTCHDFSEFILARINQYDKSGHASGANIDRNGESCARCHTSKGFRDFIHDGTLAEVQNPTAINCRTCHPIHESYTTADYAVRTSDAVALTVGNASYDFGSSNMCANCHQARPISPFPTLGGDPVTITNARIGPHYGPQANMFTGHGPYKVPGSMAYTNSAHTTRIDKGCVTCHMGPAVGYMAGGHQMNIKYTTSSGATAYNYSGCSSCHTNTAGLTTTMNSNRSEIQGLIAQLRDKLIEKGLLNPATDLVPVPQTVSANDAGAIINYRFVYGDASYGAHNFPFTKALLVNTLESLN